MTEATRQRLFGISTAFDDPVVVGAAVAVPAGQALAGAVRPRPQQRGGQEQAQEIAEGAAVVQRGPPRAHGVGGEEERSEEGAGHRLYIGRAV